MLKIFVDDLRIPVDKSWTLATNVHDAIKLIKQADTFALSLDHDLGERGGKEETTREIINWCVKNGYRPSFAVVHSANPVGKKWLNDALLFDFGSPIPYIKPPRWIG